MSFINNSFISQAEPETFASTSRMDLLATACDYAQTISVNDAAQTISVNDAAAILVSMKDNTNSYDANYEKLLKEYDERIEKDECKKIDDERILAARWFMLFSSCSGDMTPPILENNYSPDILTRVMLLENEPYDPYSIWTPFTTEQLHKGVFEFWGSLSYVTTFDKTTTLDMIANSMFQNRPLTRTELILAMKCNYIAKHRAWALSVNFNFGPLMRTFRRRCGFKEAPCICAHIEPNFMYS
jgi:hypothetical protein